MITIQLLIVAKVIIYLGLSLVLAVVFLFPINDTPTSRAQWVAFIVVEILLLLAMFRHAFVSASFA